MKSLDYFNLVAYILLTFVGKKHLKGDEVNANFFFFFKNEFLNWTRLKIFSCVRLFCETTNKNIQKFKKWKNNTTQLSQCYQIIQIECTTCILSDSWAHIQSIIWEFCYSLNPTYMGINLSECKHTDETQNWM